MMEAPTPTYTPILSAYLKKWNRNETLYTTDELVEVLQFLTPAGANEPVAIIIKEDKSLTTLPIHLLEAI
jgi:hypothetical protein